MAARRWLILVISMFAQGTVGLFGSGIPAIAPALQRQFGMTLLQTGSLFSAVSAGAILTATLWGVAADRWGERTILGLGLGGGALAIAGLAAARTYPAAIVLVLLAGASLASANVGSGRALMAWFAPAERGLAIGFRQMSIPVAGAAAALALPPLVTGPGTPWAFVLVAAFCAATGVAAIAGLGSPPRVEAIGSQPAARQPMADRRLWRLALAGGLVVLGQICLLAYLVLFLTDVRHLPLQLAALALVAAQLGGAVIRILIGRQSDRLGGRIRPLRWIALSAAGLYAAGALAMDAPLPILLPILVSAMSVGMGANGLAYTAAAEVAGLSRAGAAMGFLSTVFLVAGAVSPILFGAVISLAHWKTAVALLAICAAASWLLLRPLLRGEAAHWQPGTPLDTPT
jgi:sugar phosphate permease